MEKELDVRGDAYSFKVEPESINFGCLKPGEGGTATLKATGGTGQVVVNNDYLKVGPSSFNLENSELKLMLLAGSAGELIWDSIILQGESGEVRVLVTARWGIPTSYESEVKPGTDRGEIQVNPGGGTNGERTFKGRTCRWCGKNLRYDADSHSWEACKTCRGARIPVSLMLRMLREFYLGVKDLGPSVMEIWETLLGKEKKRR